MMTGEPRHPGPGNITPAMEDYLKAIYALNETRKVVRVKDIAKKMNKKMPSVTSMVQKLSKFGLVKHRKYEYVELEDAGTVYAREIHRRHEILLRFLSGVLTVEKNTADCDACKLEHLISPETLGKLDDFMSALKSGINAYKI